MIYVKGRRDVTLSKGWRYEPIMINASHSCTHPAPLVHSSVTRGEALQHFSICTTPSSCLLVIHVFFFFLSDIVPCFFFFSVVAAHLLAV